MAPCLTFLIALQSFQDTYRALVVLCPEAPLHLSQLFPRLDHITKLKKNEVWGEGVYVRQGSSFQSQREMIVYPKALGSF